jgi:predicted esterase
MLSNRPLTDEEQEEIGLIGKIRDNSALPWGERVGVVLVHGRAGNEALMWVFSKCIDFLDPIVFAPRAILADKIGGYSWWEVDDAPGAAVNENVPSNSPNAGWDKLNPSINALELAVESLPAMYGVDPKKIIAIGFSQGGALISSLSLKRPELFKGVAILASFIPNIVREKYVEVNFSKLPAYFMSHGTEDEIIPFEKALLTKEFIAMKAKDFIFHSDKVTHKISSSGIKGLAAWIKGLEY